MVNSVGQRPLTEDDVKLFKDRGYFMYHRQLFSPAELDRLSSIFDEHRAAEVEKKGDEFDTPHFQDRRLLDFLLAPQVLDLVECIVGPDILLWSSHFISKDPLTGRATPWHEFGVLDGKARPVRQDRYGVARAGRRGPGERLYASHPRFPPDLWVVVVPGRRHDGQYIQPRDHRH